MEPASRDESAAEPSGEPVSLGVLVAGFRQARARFDVAKLQRDPVPAFHALFEALAWAVSVDERLGYPDHAELRGLRYVRHAIHHQWADALELYDGGAEFPVTFPLVFFEWRWRPDVPPPRNRKDESSYVDYLAGRAARRTLEAVAAFFDSQ